MIHITQVMIADGDTEFTHLLCRALRAAEGFAVSGIYQTATGLENIVRETNPDVLLLDLMLPDALTALRELDGLSERQRPCIFVLSSFVSAEISAECDRLGINFFLRKPVSIASLIDILSRYGAAVRLSAPHASEASTQYDIVLQIRHLLGDLQFPAHVMGYRYLRDSILMTIEDPSVADSVTKLLYPAIAKKYNTTWTSVERDMRNAVSIAWNRCGSSFPGYSFSRRPANRELILTLADRIRYELHLDLCADVPSPHDGIFS